MNKKLKRILATVSAVAVCAVSMTAMTSGAVNVPSKLITIYTTSFTCGGIKYHLWQEATDYFDDDHNGNERAIIFISEPLEDDDGSTYYIPMCATNYTWEIYCDSPNPLITECYVLENEDDVLLLENCLSEYSIEYDVRDSRKYNSDGEIIGGEIHIYPKLSELGVHEKFETLIKIKEETGFSVGWYCSQVGRMVTDIENEIEPTLSGDANEDGKVSIADAVLIMQALSNPDEYQLTMQGMANADIVGDGDGVTAMDALRIQEMELGK